MAAAASYSPDLHKRLKEEFVSNLQGTTMLEIAALSALVPVFVIFRQCMHSIFPSGKNGLSVTKENPKSTQNKPNYWQNLAVDFLVVIVPSVACLTVAADWVYTILAAMSGVLLVMLSSQMFLSSTTKGVPAAEEDPSRKGYISSYRFVMMLVTCVTILAVDFTAFPRRYGKTETYGTGLMDIGVGSFVVANALVSRQARNLPPSKHGGILRNTSPLLILGFVRLIVTKGVDYQEHVGEYGVHWNFFFTLAGVGLLTSLICIPSSWCGSLGVFLLTVYQIVLSSGLNVYLMSPQRGPGLLSLNKEGIASTVGYWGLYLISVQLGYHLNLKEGSVVQKLWHSKEKKKKDYQSQVSRWGVMADIWAFDMVLWVLAFHADYFVERISRRTCNLAYVLFVLAQNFEVIGIFMLADVLLPLQQLSVLNIFDNNMLPTFLVANLLTGAVNMSMHTIFVAPAKAFATLLLYMAVLVGCMGVADKKKLRLKFW